MKFVCLLRGINVGGKNAVSMKILKEVLINHGYDDVITYINSGNIIFKCSKDKKDSEVEIEKLIEHNFQVKSKVLVLSKDDFLRIANEIPIHYQNDEAFKADMLFFMEGAKELASKLKFKADIEEYKILDNALIYGVSRSNQTKSSLMKIIGTPFYHLVTIRNVNTVRKLAELLDK